jgi:tRNA dimethylallyltransferase
VNPSMPLLVVIVGPTASGKTALSLHLAEQLGGEIISCDSVAAYREFEIGTAKPSVEDRRRVPHHLIDVASPVDEMTAGDYARLARQAAQQIQARGRIPIVVGGTGLYLRALLDGLFAGPPRSEELRTRLREISERRGAGYLHRVLRRVDAQAAQSIHANDVPKIIRAIEVSLAARRPMTEMWREGRDALQGFHIIRLGLNPDRALLYQRINERAHAMFTHGLLEETRALAERYGPGLRPLLSLGYAQAMQNLRGTLSLEQAIAAAQQGHRNYAKRQMTWFRREPNVFWMEGFGHDPQIQQRCVELITAAKTTR